jgi:ABC-type transporter MlaC component
MSSRRTLLILASMALAAAAVTPALAASAMVKPAEELVSKAANEFLDAVRDGSHRDDFARVFDRYVSMEAIAMFALGKHRRWLPPDQRSDYIELVRTMLLNTVTKHGKQVRGRTFVVTGSRGSVVSGYIQHDGDRRTGVDMRLTEGRIADIRVEGIWLAFILRQEFNRIIDGGNGDISAIFDYLKRGAAL